MTEPPTNFMRFTTLPGSLVANQIREEPIEHSPIESIGELDFDQHPTDDIPREVASIKIVYPNLLLKKQMTMSGTDQLDQEYMDLHKQV